jgi:hypothetical protein
MANPPSGAYMFSTPTLNCPKKGDDRFQCHCQCQGHNNMLAWCPKGFSSSCKNLVTLAALSRCPEPKMCFYTH